MIKSDLLKAIRIAKQVFCWTNWSESDGDYVKIVKADLIDAISKAPETVFGHHVRWIGVDLYIG